MRQELFIAKSFGAPTVTKDGVMVSAADRDIVGVDIMTEPFPSFPTDLQAQFMALMTTADGRRYYDSNRNT